MRYYRLKKSFRKIEERQFVAANLLEIKNALQKHVPEKKLNKNMLLATWNIRDFDSNKFGHGPRLKESYFYLAEILSGFDLIAVQEVNKNLKALRNLMYVMGDNWDFITTDTTAGAGGNGERMTFIYDKRRVSFENVAGEIVLPTNSRIKGDIQFARTPFLVSFQSGWSKFSLCTVHIYYGASSGVKLDRRVNEIHAIAKFLKKKADSDKETLILLGDFNIVDQKHKTMEALLDNGFEIPEQIRENPAASNMLQTKFYDQIGVRSKSEVFKLGTGKDSAGVFNFFDSVMREDQFENYKPYVVASALKQLKSRKRDLSAEHRKSNPSQEKIIKLKASVTKAKAFSENDAELEEYYFNKWKTFQMSDHLPMWTEIITDHSHEYLNSIVE
ncbi:MAG: endonuclease/exonuclease/phosphatase family metal-dependent hydrolase [Salibacteraceae bacterium]|jgi:endonuclease/exonuclease/phosphatase family metal-dependent hydrolase